MNTETGLRLTSQEGLLGSGVLPPGGHITRALLTPNAHTNLVKGESTQIDQYTHGRYYHH